MHNSRRLDIGKVSGIQGGELNLDIDQMGGEGLGPNGRHRLPGRRDPGVEDVDKGEVGGRFVDLYAALYVRVDSRVIKLQPPPVPLGLPRRYAITFQVDGLLVGFGGKEKEDLLIAFLEMIYIQIV